MEEKIIEIINYVAPLVAGFITSILIPFIIKRFSIKSLEKKINEATPNDIMSLYLIVSLRFDRNYALDLKTEEMPFIKHLEKYASLRSDDKKKLSSFVIHDQLLPLLNKIKNKI